MSALAVDDAAARVSVVMVLRDEPIERVQRALDALALQRGAGAIEVVIAAPPADHEQLGCLHVHGAIESVTVIANLGGARSVGLNLAVAAAQGSTIVRLDARSTISDDYVSRCVSRLVANPEVGVVGGVQWPHASASDARARAAARALRNRWLLGNAGYRCPGYGGPADTVYLGAFRRNELQAIGGYDERLAANEDFELCARYRDAARTVWLEADLLVEYEPRCAPRELFDQYHAFGRSKMCMWRLTGRRPNRRQQVALGASAVAVVAGFASVRQPTRIVMLALGAVVGIAVLDHLAEPDERDVNVRARAWAASAAILTGWLSGVATGVGTRVR